MQTVQIEFVLTDLEDVCRLWHIRRLSLFGSVLRDDFGPDSDVDVLVEFEHGHAPTLFSVERLRRELSGVFGGRDVDLTTPAALSPYVREQVLESAQVGYAA